ncbi:hypothetical protein A3B84_01410 [Candidatus Nomurabacteria bacterium RIFCSPHIGHO2_02_FULL_35_13]|uniref:Uncharacterized protein n=1 Tax=Candidatus Nomurabacteria bacterium RIFCSPHIGHO2_02_FULL_35_13 TaxID=1801748 RepID=A0A1F6VNK5_9BACT|nr:MAG: hypothetical protein A3B84_01410 [Candidatus Nomurabacteria bacterium RIFCSPHIGHO2_02_FULL_35_13]
MNKKKIVIIVVILVIIIVVIGYLFLSSKTPFQSIENVNQGVLPSLGESTNPLKNKPNVNPVDVSNPFRSIKTNPFQ